MARTERTAAVLLRSVAYGEADRIVTLLTESRGKVGLMARGARKSSKRFGAALEPYTLVEAEIAMGRGDLGRLASARGVRVFPGILADLGRMSVAAAGLELVRLAVADADPPDERLLPTVVRLFELAEGCGEDALRLAFSARVLALVGLEPSFERCGRCGRPAPEGKAALFDPQLGAVVCRACGGAPIKLSGGARRRLIGSATRRWDEIALEVWPEPDRAAAVDAIEAFAERHLGRRLAAGRVVGQVREVQRAYSARRAAEEET